MAAHLLFPSGQKPTSSTGPSVKIEAKAEFVEAHDATVAAFREQLIGTWHLHSYVYKLHAPITVPTYPHGKTPVGQLLYTADGYMSVHIMEPGCTLFKGHRPHRGTKDEMANAMSHYQAYSGRFTTGYFGSQKLLTVKHIVKTALYPNWVGVDQLRVAKVTQDELILTPEILHKWHVRAKMN